MEGDEEPSDRRRRRTADPPGDLCPREAHCEIPCGNSAIDADQGHGDAADAADDECAMDIEGDMMLLHPMLGDDIYPPWQEQGSYIEDTEHDVFGHGGELDQLEEPAAVKLSGARPDEGAGRNRAKWVPRQAGSSTDGMQVKIDTRSGRSADDDDDWMQHRASIDLDSHIVYEAARAKSTQVCVVGAREGPEGPRDACATVAAAPSLGRDAAATVTAKREAAILRSGNSEAAGPPSGAAAPLESCKRDTAEKRPSGTSPQKRPKRPAAGAGRPVWDIPQEWPQRPVAGRATRGMHSLKETPMSQAGVVRRRDGADDPAAQSAVARGGGDATALGRRKGPCEGSNSCVPNARNECKARRGSEEKEVAQDVREGPPLRRGLPREHRAELGPPGAQPRRHGPDDLREAEGPRRREADKNHEVDAVEEDHGAEELHQHDHGASDGGLGLDSSVNETVADRAEGSLVESASVGKSGQGDGSDGVGGERPIALLRRAARGAGRRGRHRSGGERGVQLRGTLPPPRRGGPDHHHQHCAAGPPYPSGHGNEEEGEEDARLAKRLRAEPSDEPPIEEILEAPMNDLGGTSGAAAPAAGVATVTGPGRPVWMLPPGWLYLPHLGWGGGHSGERGVEEAMHSVGKNMHDGFVASASAGRAAPTASISAGGSKGPGGQEPSAAAIRGRELPLGSDAIVCNLTDLGLGGCAAISGRDHGALGGERGGSARPARRVHDDGQIAGGVQDEDGTGRVRGPVKRRSPGMEWYLADIAGNVARRRAAFGAQEKPSAMERMVALRRRIADRARGEGAVEGTAPLTGSDATSTRALDNSRGTLVDGEGETSWLRQSSLEPVARDDGPSCATARSVAATEVAHHAIECEARRMGVGDDRRRGPSLEASASRNARQALIDRLSSRTMAPERTA